MLYAGFANLDDAAAHRRNHGGWIFLADSGPAIWFHPSFTATPIMLHQATRGLSGRLI